MFEADDEAFAVPLLHDTPQYLLEFRLVLFQGNTPGQPFVTDQLDLEIAPAAVFFLDLCVTGVVADGRHAAAVGHRLVYFGKAGEGGNLQALGLVGAHPDRRGGSAHGLALQVGPAVDTRSFGSEDGRRRAIKAGRGEVDLAPPLRRVKQGGDHEVAAAL